MKWKIDGKPIYDLNIPEHRKDYEVVGTESPKFFENSADLRERVKHLEPYTDDNLGDEFTGIISF